MIEAVIFDFDGLILDTETPDFLSWQELYADFGVELPLTAWHNNIGSSDLFNPYLYLEQLLDHPIDRAAVHARRKQRDNELLAAQTVLPGVVDYLDVACQRGLKIGLASSSHHAWVDHHLERLGLFNHFEVIVCRDDVDGRSKPDPAVYQAAVEALHVLPDRALALEDSPNGVQAAKTAGLFCAAVPNPMTKGLNFDQADAQMTSLTDLPLDRLIEEVLHGKT